MIKKFLFSQFVADKLQHLATCLPPQLALVSVGELFINCHYEESKNQPQQVSEL